VANPDETRATICRLFIDHLPLEAQRPALIGLAAHEAALTSDPSDVKLRAFAEAMTPEKWDHVLTLLRLTMYDPDSPIGQRSAEIAASVEALQCR